MKKKKTLTYFRLMIKTDNMSSLISNWYRLEEVLGFSKQVSPLRQLLEILSSYLVDPERVPNGELCGDSCCLPQEWS